MFGGSTSPPKEKTDLVSPTGTSPTSLNVNPDETGIGRPSPPSGKKQQDEQSAGDKKRRSSSVNKAASFFSSAKSSLHLSSRDSSLDSTHGPQTVFQKLGKMDPALTVPQGSLNNSAGESVPTLRSSFRVGVTEDRNRKCRRTMEDTHAYLYNFLGTPSPASSSAIVNGTDAHNVAQKLIESDESTYAVETDNGYFAIFDGHAGTFAAEWCGKKLHLILEEVMRKNPNSPVPELLDQAFTSVDQQLEKLPVKNSGCTAVAAVLRWEDRIPSSHSATGSAPLAPAAAPTNNIESEPEPNPDSVQKPAQSKQDTSSTKSQENVSRQRVLYTANVGDARIVLCRNGKALRLSYDHKGSDENEGKRIANAGGLILNNRVNGVLAVTRALGDAYLKDLVTGHPYTTETVVQADQDEFLILACDGLWDVCTDQEAVDLIRNVKDSQEASKILVDHALSRFSTDNLTCMVVRFDANLIRDVVERRSEPIGVEGDPSSQVKGGISEADKIVEGAKKKLENPDASPVETGLNSKIMQVPTPNESSSPQLNSPNNPESDKPIILESDALPKA